LEDEMKICSIILAGLFMGAAAFGADDVKRTFWDVKTKQPLVALTFDDGPDDNCLQLVELFKKEDVKATFFFIGQKVKEKPDIVKKVAEAGHEIANHSYTHGLLIKKTPAEIKKEIVDTQNAVKEAIGVEPKLLRPPNVKQDDNVLAVLKELNMKSIMASVSASDWDKKNGKDQIIEAVTAKTKAGDIIVMHSWRKETLEGMPEIIKRLKEKGFKFVTVSELISNWGK